MKKTKKLAILVISPILMEAAALLFLPAQIPIHYNLQLQPDGYGSKYMLLILGISVLLFGAFMLWLYRMSEQKPYGKLVYWLSIVTLLLFQVINICGILGAMVS